MKQESALLYCAREKIAKLTVEVVSKIEWCLDRMRDGEMQEESVGEVKGQDTTRCLSKSLLLPQSPLLERGSGVDAFWSRIYFGQHDFFSLLNRCEERNRMSNRIRGLFWLLLTEVVHVEAYSSVRAKRFTTWRAIFLRKDTIWTKIWIAIERGKQLRVTL